MIKVPSQLGPCCELDKFDANSLENYDLDAIVPFGCELHSGSPVFVIVQPALQGTRASWSPLATAALSPPPGQRNLA